MTSGSFVRMWENDSRMNSKAAGLKVKYIVVIHLAQKKRRFAGL